MWPFKNNTTPGSDAVQRGAAQAAQGASDPVIQCPRCSVDMKKITRNNIVIDFCGTCHGMWLDHGELTKLIDLHGPRQGKKDKHIKKNIKKKSLPGKK